MRPLDQLLATGEQSRVVAAIRDAESRTSGQIKVHVEDRCAGEAMARARHLFTALGLEKTRARNAVLVYVAPGSRRYAVLGDSAIHARGGDALWSEAAAVMQAAFARGALGDGLVAAIERVGSVLAREFPADGPTDNELTDDLSTSPAPSGDARP